MTETESTCEAAFAIDAASNSALRALIEKYGEEAAALLWKLGWYSGHVHGLERAKETLVRPMSDLVDELLKDREER